MQTSGDESIDSVVPLFNVVISMPPDADLETIQKLAEIDAGLTPERVERLMKVLRSTPNAKVGTGLPRKLAEEEKARFIKAGLHVDVIPMLPMQPATASGTANNSPETVIASMQIPILEEFEEINTAHKGGFFTGKAGILISTTLAIVMGMLYMGEKGVTIGGMSLPWGKKETLPGAMNASSSQKASAGVSAAGGQASATGAAGLASSATAELSSDADVDDPLIQAAVASGAAGAVSSGATNKVPKQTKQLLTAEFASVLAEIGQEARARAVLKALAGSINPATETQAASALQATQIKLQAWSAQRMDGGQARQVAEDLKAKTQGIVSAQERTLLQGQVAVILSRNMQLPPEVARMFLSMGAESLKAVDGMQTNASLGDLTVSMAEVFFNETTVRARTGAWSKARVSAAQVEDLLKQAPDAWTQSRLYAVDHQAKLQTSQTDKAAKSLESALVLAGKNGNLTERAMWLRSIAQLSDATTQEQFEAAATTLQNQLNAKSGIEKARGLTELSLLYTVAGLPGKSAQLRSLAQATAGLSPEDSLAINTDLMVRNDIAMAKSLHGLGRYADAEAALQRVGSYLF